MLATRARLTTQLLRFAAVGTVGFVVDATVLYAVADHLGLYLGRLLSFWAAATVTWLLNRRYTFEPADRADTPGGGRVRQYARYIVSMLAGAAVNYLAYVAALQAGMHPIAAVALGSLAGLAINFCSARWMVFNQRKKHAPCKH